MVIFHSYVKLPEGTTFMDPSTSSTPGTSAGRLAHALLCDGFVVRELRVAQRGLQRQDVPRDLLQPGHPKAAGEVAQQRELMETCDGNL